MNTEQENLAAGRGFRLARPTSLWSLWLICGVLSLAASLIRPVPVVPAASFGLLLLFAGYVGWRRRERVPGTLRRSLKTGVLLLVSIVLGGILLEGGARMFLPKPPVARDWMVDDPDYVYLLKPSTTSTFTVQTAPNESRPIQVRTSSQGLRDRIYGPKASDEFRILLLGDSFTMGHAVEEPDAIPRQLERLLAEIPLSKRITVINAGCTGAGPLEELGMLRRRGLPLEPDLVILQTLATNDFEDSLVPFQKCFKAYSPSNISLQVFRQRNKLLPYRVEWFFRNHSQLYRHVRAAMGLRPLVVQFFKHLRGYPAFAAPPPLPREDRPPYIEANLRSWYPEIEEGFQHFQDYVREIRAECRSHSIDFVGYCQPDINDVSLTVWTNSMKETKGFDRYEWQKALHKVEAFLKQEGIPTFSVLEALQAAPDIDQIYFRYDGHLTALGNGIVAQRMRDYLITEYVRIKDLTVATTP